MFVDRISFDGNHVEGSLALLQSGGQLMGLRSHFGLAPIPSTGVYQFGGSANLSFLQPTAGREAISRESIDQVALLIVSAEFAASELLSQTDLADRNNAFLQWLVSNNRWDLAKRVLVSALPEGRDIELGGVQQYIGSKPTHYYAGTDLHIINTFANEGACLLQVAQNPLRRRVQLHYLSTTLGVAEVPDSVRVTRTYDPRELTAAEASVLLRISSILRDDYLIPDVDVMLVDMSHGVTVLPEKVGEQVCIKIARTSPLLAPVIEFRESAFEVFGQFMKDFVRVHIYPRIQQFVPSSTKGGVDALKRLLERNRELYRYEDTERGDLEGVLGEYLSGSSTLTEVVKHVRGGMWSGGRSGQSQKEIGRAHV